MTAVSSDAILGAWGSGRTASPGQRGLILLAIADPDRRDTEQAARTVGDRDAALLDLYRRTFGAVMDLLADCPDCAEILDIAVPVDAVRVAPPSQPGPYLVAWDGGQVGFRLPNAGDLAALPDASVDGAARWLARRCLTLDDPALDDDAMARLEAAIDAAVMRDDPQAVVTLDFGCPGCGRAWTARLDIVDLLWRRVDDLARALLGDVHLLASAYGWTERAILALPASRRQHYLELLGA